MSRLKLLLKGRGGAVPDPDPGGGGLLAPSVTWNGTADSGASAPTDPTRTTAKPSLNPLFAPWLTFTDDVVIGFQAMAKGGIGAVDKVIFHLEGTTLEVTAPTTHTYTDVNGVTQSQYGFHATLDYSAFAAISTSGTAHLYAEAVSLDGSMQHRVMGPYPLYARTAAHDRTSTVGSGGTYSTLKAAIDAGHTAGARRQEIVIVATGEYELATVATVYANSDYWTTIRADTAVTAKIVAADVTDVVQSRHDGLHFKGSGIHICPDRMAQFAADEGSRGKIHFEGVTWGNDSGDRNTLQKGGVPYVGMINSAMINAFATDCVVTESYSGLNGFRLVKNSDLTGIAGVALQNVVCLHGVTVTDLDCTTLVDGINAMTITRAAGPTTATYEVSGTPGNSRTLTLKENGSTITNGTLSISTTSNGSSYTTVQDVVDWVNTKSGWTATHTSSARRAVQLSKAGLAPSAAITATNCLSTVATLTTVFDVHSDGIHNFGASIQNRNGYGVSILAMELAQGFFCDQSSTDLKDCNYSNILVEKVGAQSIFSRIGSVCSHVSLDYSTFVDQQFILDVTNGLTADTYCGMTNVVAEAMSWDGTADSDFDLDYMHIRSGSAPSGATNSTTGGTNATLYNDPAGDDYSPISAGTLLRTNATYAGRYLPTGAEQ